MYDWAHTLSDSSKGSRIRVHTGVEVHRPLYDWILDALECRSRARTSYEFREVHLTYTVMSKRKLSQFVNEKLVKGGTIRAC